MWEGLRESCLSAACRHSIVLGLNSLYSKHIHGSGFSSHIFNLACSHREGRGIQRDAEVVSLLVSSLFVHSDKIFNKGIIEIKKRVVRIWCTLVQMSFSHAELKMYGLGIFS